MTIVDKYMLSSFTATTGINHMFYFIDILMMIIIIIIVVVVIAITIIINISTSF